jgi:nucleoside-diphosphate-sugar epimerase
MKKVLVVGGAGYIGCVLVEELLAKGYSVRVLDRLFFGREPIRAFADRVELIEEDMRAFDRSHVADCGAVINIGGLSNDPTAEFAPRANEEMNTHASIRVAEVAKEAGVQRLIFGSTASIYDRGVGEESRDLLLDEEFSVDPKAAYATSKLGAERGILPLAGDGFAPVAFRMGTVFGYSPRMRYDLVVNTFVKDALSEGKLHIFNGGEMWRPLIDVQDVARAYVTALECDADSIAGQVFNLAARNYRISELALRALDGFHRLGMKVQLDMDYSYRPMRSYRISSEKVFRVLGFRARVEVDQSVERMVTEVRRRDLTDFTNPRYYNIEWMKLLEEIVGIVSRHGYVLSKPGWDQAESIPREEGGGEVTRLPSPRARPAG